MGQFPHTFWQQIMRIPLWTDQNQPCLFVNHLQQGSLICSGVNRLFLVQIDQLQLISMVFNVIVDHRQMDLTGTWNQLVQIPFHHLMAVPWYRHIILFIFTQRLQFLNEVLLHGEFHLLQIRSHQDNHIGNGTILAQFLYNTIAVAGIQISIVNLKHQKFLTVARLYLKNQLQKQKNQLLKGSFHMGTVSQVGQVLQIVIAVLKIPALLENI